MWHCYSLILYSALNRDSCYLDLAIDCNKVVLLVFLAEIEVLGA